MRELISCHRNYVFFGPQPKQICIMMVNRTRRRPPLPADPTKRHWIVEEVTRKQSLPHDFNRRLNLNSLNYTAFNPPKSDRIHERTKRHVLHQKIKSRQVERVHRIKARTRRQVGQIHTGLQVRSQADAQWQR